MSICSFCNERYRVEWLEINDQYISYCEKCAIPAFEWAKEERKKKKKMKMKTHTVLNSDGKLLEYTEARIGTVVGSMRIDRNREKTVIDLVTANHFGIPHEIELETFNGKHKLKAILETTTPYLGVLGKDVLGSESN